MKNSGIEWIGNIPNSWELHSLKGHLTEIKESNDPIKTTQVLSLTNKLGVVPYEEKGEQGNKAKENYDEYKLAYPNTIVANSMNILIGSVGICNYFGCVSPVYYVFKPKNEDELKFLDFIFQSQPFQKELRRYAKGILEIRLRVSANDILKRPVALPPVEQQKKIVAFLEKKLSQVDELMANQQEQIDKLKEYKQSVITEAVTKGLDKNAPMKDSGVEWIGEIPQEWRVFPLKALFSFGKGLPITKENLVEEGVAVISYGQIHAKWNSGVTTHKELYRRVSEMYLNTNSESLVKKGDLIMADTSEDKEGCGNCAYIDTQDTVFAGYHTITLKSLTNFNTKYLAYLFLTDNWRSQLRKSVSGVKLFSVSKRILGTTTVLIPKDVEKIINYLDDKCEKIDRLIAIKQEKIEKLQEYKKSLIYEYVTGKKEVA